jgi:pimeloyl-ACP methyl ester carboxylesterase
VLANRLAHEGFPVLRFDWFATGDSDGDRGDETFERWRADVGYAVEALRERTGTTRVVLVGVRLGATLAALGAADRGGVDGCVLWEPIEDGRGYADWKRRDHLEWFDIETRERPGAKGYAGPSERLGYSYSDALDAELRRVDLGSIKTTIAERALLVRNLPAGPPTPWFETLIRRCGSAERVVVEESAVWTPISDLEAPPVPAQTLRAIAEWVGRAPQ